MNSVTAANGNGAQAGYASRQVPNPDLKWEANKTFNVGIDFGFLNQRITFSPEFYINRSSNLLLNAKLPNSSGYTSMVINAGETQKFGCGFDYQYGKHRIQRFYLEHFGYFLPQQEQG